MGQRHHDITTRERDQTLRVQIVETRDSIQSSVTQTGLTITSDIATLQNNINQIAARVDNGNESVRKDLRVAQDHINQQISHSGDSNSQILAKVRAEMGRTTLLQRRAQIRTSRQLRHLHRGSKQITSLLSELSTLHLESRRNCDDPQTIQMATLEAAAFPLLQMRNEFTKMITELRCHSLPQVSAENIDFLLNEYERLVKFYQENVTHCRAHNANGQPKRRSKLGKHTFAPYDYALTMTSSLPKTLHRTYKHRSWHENVNGKLIVQFEEQVGDHENLPTTFQRASFKFIPAETHETAIYASFCKEMRMYCQPRIHRSLRVIRRLVDEGGVGLIRDVLRNDDLPRMQRMLSNGEVTPWDQIDELGNLVDVFFHLQESL